MFASSHWIFLLALSLMVGCPREPAPDGPVNEYRLEGTVVRLDAQHRTAIIQHEEIKGWMEAMTMEFPIKSQEEFLKLKPGMRIRARVLQRQPDMEYWLDSIEPVAEEKPPAAPGQNR